jgi:oligopeptide transport system substrate-binding protein
MRKFLSLLLALLLTLAVPAAFAEAQATETLAADQDLTFSLPSVPTIDPQQFNAAPSYVVMKGIGEGLIRTHEGQVYPGVAESWEVAEDNLKMTFHLRKGACWADGSPLTASDFVYAFRRLADPAKPRDYSWVLYEIKNAAGVMDGSLTLDQLGVSAPDDSTFVIEFTTPAPYYLGFLDLPCFYPVKQELVEKFGDQYALSADSMLTNGPFTVADYQVDQSIKLVPNENYWNREAIKLSSVTIDIMETEAAFSMLETGELDLADIPVAIAPTYLADPASIPGATITSYASGAVDWFCINIASTTNPILGNQDFRLALNYALDREEYVAIATNGLYAPATRFVLPLVAGADGGYYTEQYPINVYKSTAEPDKAAEHLKKAMDAMGITDPSAITVKLKVSDTATNKLIGENCQDQWQRTLGIKVEIETVTYKAMLADRTASNFDLVYAGWMPDYNDPYTYLSYFTSTNPQNGGKFADARYDELVNTANTFADAKTRLSMYAEAEQILMEQAGIVPLQVRQVPYGISEKLKGLVRFYLGSDLDFAYAYFVE